MPALTALSSGEEKRICSGILKIRESGCIVVNYKAIQSGCAKKKCGC
jgi:hypothetical protein